MCSMFHILYLICWSFSDCKYFSSHFVHRIEECTKQKKKKREKRSNLCQSISSSKLFPLFFPIDVRVTTRKQHADRTSHMCWLTNMFYTMMLLSSIVQMNTNTLTSNAKRKRERNTESKVEWNTADPYRCDFGILVFEQQRQTKQFDIAFFLWPSHM